MNCLRCFYPLQGNDSRVCPECGLPFDPNNPLTLAPLPESALPRGWVSWLYAALLGFGIALAALACGLTLAAVFQLTLDSPVTYLMYAGTRVGEKMYSMDIADYRLLLAAVGAHFLSYMLPCMFFVPLIHSYRERRVRRRQIRRQLTNPSSPASL